MSIIIMLILISVLILVHEAGHFLTARMFNIKVEKFGFGLPIGPTLFEKKIGDVAVLVHAFLLGGYVAFPDDDKDCTLDKDSLERFANKPIWQRAVVASAGVGANVLCAIVFVLVTAQIWGFLPSGKYDIYIKDIMNPKTAPISLAGAKPLDKIVEINGTRIDNTYALMKTVELSKKHDDLIFKSRVDENLYSLMSLNPAFSKNETIPKGVHVKLPLGQPEPIVYLDSMAQKGLKQPKITQIKLSDKHKAMRNKINGGTYYTSTGVENLSDIAYAISDTHHPLLIKVERNGKIIALSPIELDNSGKLGVQLSVHEKFIKTETPASVIKQSGKYLWENTYMLVYGLYQLFTGQVPMKDLHGIVAITKIGGDMITQKGLDSGLLLIAIISMDLAIINILPIPALDGGHLLFLFLEKIHGKPIDEKIVEKIANLFFILLVLLMVFVVFNDIFALITKKF